MTNFGLQSWKRLLMCRPTHFDVVHRGLNAYMTMDDPVDKPKALSQWEKLKETFHTAGIKVDIMENAKGLVDQVFCANSAIVWGGKAFISCMINTRRTEADHSINWFKSQNFEVHDGRQHNLIMEGGGDFGYSFDRKNAFLGYGIRTEEAACDIVKDVLGFKGTEVHKLKLINEYCYHLDTAMLHLSRGHVLAYPEAFDKGSLNLIKEVCGEENVIEISKEDCMDNFAPNSVPVKDGDQHGLIGMDFTQPLQHKLKDLGYNLITTPYKEFHKSGGSIRCSVLDIGI